uniref:Low-density lipoprotein receptor-like isoform X2 n=1 Tax=Dermatophagoides pteronyssinus TaxID=6956 RepID=A0A6P6Y263_DERPT|nr:low-density lipoprotein receptor-like isoform X2 [Dermatophagoides pteronyssinus]
MMVIKLSIGILLSLSLIELSSSSDAIACHDSFFDCGNGKCIAPLFICDGDNDCGNYHDELSCNSVENITNANAVQQHLPCPSHEFACNDAVGNCIPQRWVCDGQSECSNNADEANCTAKNPLIDCRGDFRCVTSFECIPPKWVCDGVNDCMDHSDESNCSQIHDPNEDMICDKLHDRYRCQSNGLCIAYELVCDGKPDCPDGDDEQQNCHAKKCQDKKCSHQCLIDEHTQQPKCSCPPGFELQNDGHQCKDFDECSQQKQLNLCSQLCINLLGNYRCDCFDDYHLIDNRTCVANGKQSPILYFSTGNDIHGYDLRNKIIFPVITLNEYDPSTIIDLELSISDGRLYYSVFHNESLFSSVYEIPIDGRVQEYPVSSEQNRRLFHDIKSQIEGISLDWLANNLYMTEANRERIVVCNTQTLICSTLIENLPSPRGIVVVRSRYRLYWTQWHDRQGGIYESLLDGTEQTRLFTDVQWPNDIVYDQEMNRLYWCDGKTGSIEYYDFDIETRRIVHEDFIRQPYSMIVFEDQLYWTDWIAKKLFGCQKIHCHEQSNIFQPTISKRRGLYGMTLYHPLRQPPLSSSSSMAKSDPCLHHRHNPCSHICLSRTNETFTCRCPDHMYLSNDNRTCMSRSDNFLIINTGSRLYKFYPDSVDNEPFELIPMIPSVFLINDLAYNYEISEFYLYDRLRDRIVRARMEPEFIYHTMVDDDLSGVFGLTFEINSNNLYWVDMIKGSMEVVSIQKGYRAILNDKLDQPVSMAINALTKTIYVGLKSKNAQILMLTMDGQFVRSLLRSKQGFPFALLVYPFKEQLILGDPVLERIDIIELDHHHHGHQQSHLEPKKFLENHVNTVQSMALLNSTLYWTNAESPRLYWTDLQSSSTSTTNKRIESKKLPYSNVNNDELKVISGFKHTKLYDYCRTDDGGMNNSCHHICLIGRTGPICQCNRGFDSQDNGHTCHRNHSLDSKITKPVVHVINLEDIFDFIISKQKDSIFDQWIDSDTNSTTTNTTTPTNDQKSAEESQSEQQSSSNDSPTFLQRNSPYLWFIALCMVTVSILLCVKLNVLPVPRINSLVNLVVHRQQQQHRQTLDTIDDDDEESNKNSVRSGQVRFFSNPNYQLDHHGNLKNNNNNNMDNDLLIS